jgi:hypothetical protein
MSCVGACASTTLPGHRITFLQLPRQQHTHLRPPYATPPTPSTQRHTEYQNAQVGNNHLRCSCHLRPPISGGWSGMNRGGFNAPSAICNSPESSKTRPTSSDSASVRSDDVDDNRAQLCAQSRQRRALGSPLKLPRKFQGAGGTGSARTRRWSRATCMFQAL